jgi:Ca2+-binding EF-hand superfamily protein
MAAVNQALVFVKPHAANDKVRELVQSKLAEKKIRVLSSGQCTAETIDSDKIIDKHYATIARYAMEWTADKLPLDDATKQKFETTFGVTWDSVLGEGKVLNATEAAAKLGNLTATQLSEKWKSNSKRQKLAPGLYVTQFADDGIFVINGFYLLNREKFTKPGGVVSWYIVEWDESDLPWVDFRAKVVGPTDPTQAPTDSLRGIIFNDWQALGLAEQPNVSDNGVHASAGPVEGLAERITWTGATVEGDSFGKQLLGAGFTEEQIKGWLGNPTATLKGKTAPIFDLLEDHQTSDVLSIVKEAYAAAESKPAEETKAAPKEEATAKPATEKDKSAKSETVTSNNNSGKTKREFTADEKKRLETVFKLLDEDKSGFIDVHELPNVVRYMGYTPSEAAAKELVKKYDANHDGRISLQEFYDLCATEDIQQDTDDDLRAAFEEFDTDKSGYLSKKELQDALSQYGEPMSQQEIEDMFRGIDVNGDGKISIAEFVSAMRAPAY